MHHAEDQDPETGHLTLGEGQGKEATPGKYTNAFLAAGVLLVLGAGLTLLVRDRKGGTPEPVELPPAPPMTKRPERETVPNQLPAPAGARAVGLDSPGARCYQGGAAQGVRSAA